MDLPATSWQWLAWQIPLALVIVFLTVYFLRHLKESTKDMLDFMRSQSDVTQKFLEAQQQANRESLGRMADEIKGNKVEMLKELSQLTQRVDSVIDKALILERLTTTETARRMAKDQT